MITFNNIVSKFEEFVENHYFLKTFSYGSPADVDLDKFEQYPLLHLVYTGGDFNSPKAKTYNLEVYILTQNISVSIFHNIFKILKLAQNIFYRALKILLIFQKKTLI